MEGVFVKLGKGLIHMWHRSNYDCMDALPNIPSGIWSRSWLCVY